jgi:site-specific recombinase XerD
MPTADKNHPVNQSALTRELEEFILDRRARNVTPRTVQWYQYNLATWSDFLSAQGIQTTHAVTPALLRRFLLELADKQHNAGGIFNIFSSVKAFINWYRAEYAPADWENPLKRVKSPKRPTDLIEPIELSDFQALLKTCDTKTFLGSRDQAMLLTLLDTGVRRQECTNLNYGDVDTQTGQVTVRMGKGQKSRFVFLGNRARKALVNYLRRRAEKDAGVTADAPLWLTSTGERLTKSGLREIIRRRANKAGIPEPGLHDFRRAFAVNSLRAGMDVVTLSRLLGHTNLATVQRYLALVKDDLAASHAKHGVVDTMLD